MNKKVELSVKFYAILAVALLSLAVIVAFTAKGVIGGIKTVSEVDDSFLKGASVRLNEQNLKKALDFVDTKSAPALDSSL